MRQVDKLSIVCRNNQSLLPDYVLILNEDLFRIERKQANHQNDVIFFVHIYVGLIRTKRIQTNYVFQLK